MHTYWKAALVAPVVAIAMPVVADASYTNWKQTADVYHVYDDVRTVKFTEAVDASTLGNIVVYDETARKVVATRATVGADAREIKISLAPGAVYEHDHAYTLTIENVKSLSKNYTIKPTKYQFVMKYKEPEEVAFAVSYLVQNTSAETKMYTVPAGAAYLEQEKDGTHSSGLWSSVVTKKEDQVSLAPGEKLTLSFLSPTTLKSQDGFTIQSTTKPAFKLFIMYEGNSLRVEGKDRASQPVVYFGNPDQTTYSSYVEYETDGKVAAMDYRAQAKNGFKNESLFRNNELIVTNEDSNILYVYAPFAENGLTSVSKSNEKAIVAQTLKSKLIVQAVSTEPDFVSDLIYQSPQLSSANEQRISYAAYSPTELKGIQYNQSSGPAIYKGGDTIIKNEHTTDLVVAGPARYTTFKATVEEPLEFYTLQKDEKVSLTSKDGLQATVYALDESKRATYSVVQRNKDGLHKLLHNKEVTLADGLGSATIGNGYSALFQNNTSASLLMYGAKRSVKFEKFNGELFTMKILEPGAKVKVKANALTKVNLQDYTKRGSVIVSNSGSVKSYDFALADEWVVDLAKDEEIALENNGSTSIVVYSANGEISFP